MTIKPSVDRVVVRATTTEENKTESGIVLSNNKNNPCFAEVIAVGKAKEYEIELSVGDKVVLPHFSGVDVRIEGVDYKIVSYDEILAKIE